MSILYDTHLHTSFSPDSDTDISEQIEKAKSVNLSGICITDHTDYLFPFDKNISAENPFVFDVDKYFESIKKQAEDNPSFTVLTGVEIGLQNDKNVICLNDKLLSNHAFDEVIGSIHVVDNKDPYYPDFWEGNNHKELLKQYFELTLENLNAFSDIDILGHLDYAVRYMPKESVYDPKEFFEITDEIMVFLIKNDIALEINTSGLKKGYGFTNPHPELIKRYYELGGRLISIGSDAHSPDAVAFAFDALSEELISYGFKEYAVFKTRNIELKKL